MIPICEDECTHSESTVIRKTPETFAEERRFPGFLCSLQLDSQLDLERMGLRTVNTVPILSRRFVRELLLEFVVTSRSFVMIVTYCTTAPF